jgi:hypothetical protein
MEKKKSTKTKSEKTVSQKPKSKKKKSVKKRDWTTLRFMCLNNEGKFEIIEFPSVLGKNYIDTFGLLTVRTKEEITNWLSYNNVH